MILTIHYTPNGTLTLTLDEAVPGFDGAAEGERFAAVFEGQARPPTLTVDLTRLGPAPGPFPDPVPPGTAPGRSKRG